MRTQEMDPFIVHLQKEELSDFRLKAISKSQKFFDLRI